MSDRSASLQMLRQAHPFPCIFAFRAIGDNTPEFVARLVQVVTVVLGRKSRPQVQTRESSGGRHQAVTVRARVKTAEAVLDVYAAMRLVPGVKMLL